jgi:subtilisin family serine protease
VTRALFGASLALPLICLSAALAAPAAAVDAPNDPYFNDQWGLREINAPQAWDLSTGAGVKVAVVDTGVRATQEDLLGHVLPGWGFDGTTDDTNDHGTRVSGVIAATSNNHKGIAGVAPDASIVPIRALAGASTFDEDTIVLALGKAAESGARVVNLSFGTDPLAGREAARIRGEIDAALAAHPDTLYVAAAGNEGNDNDASPVYPCSSTQPNLICVGSYRESGALASDTNYGAETVDMFAPGVEIWTTSKFAFNYFPDSGTSMAAPFVSGEAALLFSKVPRLTPERAISLILGSAAPLQAAAAKSVSAARPDALAALQAAVVDTDRDGVYDVVDNCPTDANSTVDGCNPPPSTTPTPTPVASVQPTPTPTPRPDPVPRLRSVTTTVTRCKPHKTCTRSATVKLTPDRNARVSLRVERQVCVKRRCRWSRVLSTAVTAGTRGVRVVIRGAHSKSLKIGLYRVIAVPSSAAGTGRSATKRFRVR